MTNYELLDHHIKCKTSRYIKAYMPVNCDICDDKINGELYRTCNCVGVGIVCNKCCTTPLEDLIIDQATREFRKSIEDFKKRIS